MELKQGSTEWDKNHLNPKEKNHTIKLFKCDIVAKLIYIGCTKLCNAFSDVNEVSKEEVTSIRLLSSSFLLLICGSGAIVHLRKFLCFQMKLNGQGEKKMVSGGQSPHPGKEDQEDEEKENMGWPLITMICINLGAVPTC